MAVIYDYIVVGSGMTGAQAAQTLVDADSNVLMLDVGFKDNHYSDIVPADDDFISIRTGDESQHRYFLGDWFEGIPLGRVRHSLTPPRQFIVKDVEKWLPFESESFNLMESLSYGGLGNGWGAGCAVYPEWELKEMGLDPSEISEAYEVIARRIGVAASEDDATPYCSNGLKNRLPAIKTDRSISQMYESYLKHRHQLNEKGFYMGKTPMAVLTEDRPDRKKLQYRDMEYWTDHDRSVYRPWITVDALRTRPNFHYRSNALVLKFKETGSHVDVHVRKVDTNEDEIFRCKKLVLASGAFGSARIVLRSLPGTKRLPVITNPYSIVLSINWRMLGVPLDPLKTSLGQMEMFYDKDRAHLDVRMVSFFTYRSLLLFKLIKEIPLNMADASALMQSLQSSIVLALINHPDRPSPDKYIELLKDTDSITGDHLKIVYRLSKKVQSNNDRCENNLLKAFRKLGCFPLKKQIMEHGSTVHYAGTLPFNDNDEPYTLTSGGRLNGTRNVYVADSSGFRYLPANGLTFTLMANAHLVANRLVREG